MVHGDFDLVFCVGDGGGVCGAHHFALSKGEGYLETDGWLFMGGEYRSMAGIFP